MECTVQNIEYAVSVFYNGEHDERTKAHAWLTAVQRLPEAWNFVWELLQPCKPTEIQFYAATTLHIKILRCWNEVPPENYEEVKNKILQAVFTYSSGPKIVINRLCISLAAVILQQGTTDLATILRPLTTIENTNLLLEVLTVIPEEYTSMTMGSALRSKNFKALQQACPAVLDDMLQYLQSAYSEYKEPPPEALIQSWISAATCACSWLSMRGEDSPSSVVTLPDRIPLCRALLTAVHLLYTWNEAVSDVALDACEACLSAVRAAGGGPDPSRYPGAALELLSHVTALTASIMERDDVPNSINEELLAALITCCVTLADAYTGIIVEVIENPESTAGSKEGKTTEHIRGARQLLELLLAAQAAPGHYPLHETRSNLVFGFWYTLQDEILNIMDSTKTLHPVWKDIFSRLLTALVTKSQTPPESALTKDDIELRRCYRQDIGDTVMYCFAILGEWCWSSVEQALQRYGESGVSSEGGECGEALREAALHVFAALADAAPPRRSPPALIALLQHAVRLAHTTTDTNTLSTVLDCLGGYATWLSTLESEEAAELSRECIRAAGAALQRSPAPAALALRKLCTDCKTPAATLASDIVHAAQSRWCGWDAWVRRQLTGAAGAALAAAEPAAAAPLLLSLASTLHDDLIAQTLEPNKLNGSADCTAALMSALMPQPQLAVELYRVISPTLPAFAIQQRLIEPMFSILNETVSTLMLDSLPLMSDIAQLAVTAFNNRRTAAGLDLVKLVVLILGDEWEGASALLHTSVSQSARTLAPDPSAHADLTEGLFTTLLAITKKKPNYMHWIDDLLSDLVELACVCVRMWEAGGARGACIWLAALAPRRPDVLLPQARALTAHVLACIGGVTPRNQIEPLAELLLALNRTPWRSEHGDLAAWLRHALGNHGFPTHHATDAHKQHFITALLKEKSSKRRLLETVREFSLVCRGLIGTEYARQSLASKQLVT